MIFNTNNILFSLAAAAVVALIFRTRREAEEPLRNGSLKAGEKTYLLEPLLLPMTVALSLVMMPISMLWVAGWTWSIRLVGQLALVFLHISIYYALLLLLMPLLRRGLSPRACAALWLVPALMHLTTFRPLFSWTVPLVVVPLPLGYLFPSLILWGCGVVGILLWQGLSHLRLRRAFIGAGTGLEDQAVLAQWQGECQRHGVETEIPVLVVPGVGTPLTIGCFERTMYLVLPRTDYAPEELELIFRHELRHIIRCDSRSKVFLGFCAALYWFNPLGWLACRRAAEDMELSCDEAVLVDADQATRMRYARLLLNSAGTGRGYTTCLSAAAGTLRYRLRNVVKPIQRLPGGLAVGAALFLLLASFGTVALADSPAQARSAVFQRIPPQAPLSGVQVENWAGLEEAYRQVFVYDEEALNEYLSGLTLRRVYAGSTKMGAGPGLRLTYGEEAGPGETGSWSKVYLSGGLLRAYLDGSVSQDVVYWVEGGVDWAYLNTLLDLEARNPDPTYYAPEMYYQLNGEEELGEWKGNDQVGALWEELKNSGSRATSRVVAITDAQGRRMLENIPPWVGGRFGGTYQEAQLLFSSPPAGSYTVTVERWDGSDCYTLSSQELEGDVLPLAPYSAHYIVRGEFPVGDALYEMEFYFDIG